MDKIVGFIGCGNMAKAMIGGIISSKLISCENIIVSAKSDETLANVKNNFGVKTFRDNKDVALRSDILFLAVKPHLYATVIREISPFTKKDTIFVSIAPGKTISTLKSFFDKDVKIVRTMPNTPALVGEGITAFCPCENVSDEDILILKDILMTFGKCEEIEEKIFDAVVSISGSAPAYVFMFIEAMADAGVIQGMSREKSYKFAAQAVLGSAKMVLDTKKHPGELKDMVCSPGGTTIEAVAMLEQKGLRSAIIEAMRVCALKSSKM